MDERTFRRAVLALTALAAVLRVAFVGSQPLTADDAYVSMTAANYLELGQLGPTMWHHPPLRNVAVFLALWVGGTSPIALKFTGLLLATVTVPLLALVTRRLLGDPLIALVAAALLAIDALHIDYARQAVQEVYNAAFALGALYAALRFHDTDRWRWLGLSGALFGLGLASKWGIGFPMVVTAAYLVVAWRPEPSPTLSLRASRGLAVVTTLGVSAGVVYTLTFLPVFARGMGLTDWVLLHAAMIDETVHHQGYNPYKINELTGNAAWWFLRPVGHADVAFSGPPPPTVFIGITNPLVWMLSLPALAVLATRAYRERSLDLALPVALFASAYLPFLLAGRPIWVHSAFGAFTHALIAIAALVTTELPRRVLGYYLVLVVLISIPLYLLAIGKPPIWLYFIVEMYRPANETGMGPM